MSKQQSAILHAAIGIAAGALALFLTWLAGAITNNQISLPPLLAGSTAIITGVLVYVAHLLPQIAPQPAEPVVNPPTPITPPAPIVPPTPPTGA